MFPLFWVSEAIAEASYMLDCDNYVRFGNWVTELNELSPKGVWESGQAALMKLMMGNLSFIINFMVILHHLPYFLFYPLNIPIIC